MVFKKIAITGFVFFFSLHAYSLEIYSIGLKGFYESPTISFAKQELATFFSQVLVESGSNNRQYGFIIKRDVHLADGSFGYEANRKGNRVTIKLLASDDAGISHAVYTFLEDIGYRFEISGVIKPAVFTLDAIEGKGRKITPFTRWRGIRQHVNFPMDISSYPIEEAKEYVRNLLRMRFNTLAIHSYPNLWHEVKRKDSIDYGGNFFYGKQHNIPDQEIFRKNIRFNQKIFCIPEIEASYSNVALRSKMAVTWMQELLHFAKSIGLKVQLSIEPRSAGDLPYILETCKAVLELYPMIDVLELITEETGGWGARCTESQTRAVLLEQFGKDALNDTIITSAIRKEQTDLDNLFFQMGRNIKAIKLMQKQSWFKKQEKVFKIGIYCSIPEYARSAYRLARVYLPDNEVSVMPGHGSKRVSVNFPEVAGRRDDILKTTIYSWIEFDGLMFTQQNATEGIHDLMVYLKEKIGDHHANTVLFNHWRTAENRTQARYASVSSLFGPVEPSEFYFDYAENLGIPDTASYERVMLLLSQIDWISTNDLPNVGFCWVGAWRNGGSYTWMNRNNLLKVKNMYSEAGEILGSLLKKTNTPAGKQYLSFLENRVLASVIYLDAFGKAAEIQTIKKDSTGNLLEPEQKRAVLICNQALQLFDSYLLKHTEMMPDRGCEGTLINFWDAPVYGLKVLRYNYGKVPIDGGPVIENSKDSPPLPIK